MRFKLITIFLLLLGFYYYGCVVEPTIEPYNRPYSAVRLTNMSANLETVSLYLIPLVADVPELPDQPSVIQGPFNLGPGELSDYFETQSGAYRLAVVAANGDTLARFNVSVTSFEYLTIGIAGYHSTNSELNTLTILFFPEGEIYKKLPPGPDSISLFFLHSALASPTADAAKLTVRARIRPEGSTIVIDSNLTRMFSGAEWTAGEVEEINNLPKGDYSLTFLNGSQVIASDSAYYEGNFRYYMFIYGPPENMKLVKNVLPALPVRPKN
jgi:hypothetical protein